MMAMAAVEFLLNTGMAMRYMNTNISALLRTITPSFVIGAVMFGALYLIAPYIANLHIALRLATMIGLGGAIYLLMAWIFRLRALHEGIAILRGMLAKSE
jgi:hypothetical protein